MKTIIDFLRNPAGSGSGQVSSRYSIIQNLKDRYHKLLADKKTFSYSIYSSKNSIIFYVKVPSESLPPKSIWYDVFIELKSNASQLSKKDFFATEAKVWSNIPAFVFTYAYAATHEADIITWDWIRPYLPKKALTKPAEIRNPENIMGFEKSIYFALLYLIENDYFTLKSYNLKDWKLELPYIKKNIQKFDDVMTKYKIWKEKIAQKERAEKRKAKAAAQKSSSKGTVKSLDGKQHKVKSVKKVKKVKKV